MQIPAALIKQINKSKHIVIISHVQPDGDSIGASLALGLGLKKINKDVCLYCPEEIPHKYSFLNEIDSFQKELQLQENTLVIVLDCSDLDRIEPVKELLSDHKLLNIDHHTTNDYFGSINFVAPQAAATGEIIFFLLEEMNIPLDKDIANALYVAITTDTGSFKYENTTASTFQVASSLLQFGVEPSKVAMKVFDNRPLSAVHLLTKALETLELYSNQRIAVMTVTEQMLRDCAAQVEDLDGIINYAKNIKGVEAGLLFYCMDNNEIKVGFRSKKINISAVAQEFSGGGHPKAAGCRLKGNCNELKEEIIQSLEKKLPEVQADGEQ